MLTLWGKAFIEVRTNRQLFEYLLIVDRQNAQKFVLPCSLNSALPKESSLLLHLFCQGQANDLHEGANHSNRDGLHMNVQCDLARVAHFQSRLRSLNIYGLTDWLTDCKTWQYRFRHSQETMYTVLWSIDWWCYICKSIVQAVPPQMCLYSRSSGSLVIFSRVRDLRYCWP